MVVLFLKNKENLEISLLYTWVQFLRCRVWQTEIDNYRSLFAFLSLPTNLKNHIFEKIKKKKQKQKH